MRSVHWQAALVALGIAACGDERAHERHAHETPEHASTEHEGTEHEGTEHERTEHEGTEHERTEHEAPPERTPTACTLSETTRVLAHAPTMHAVAIATLDDATPLVLAEHDATHLDAFLVGAEPAPVLTFEMADAAALFALEAATPTRLVALTLGQCTADGRATPCVHAVALDTSDGHPTVRGQRTVLLPAPLRSTRVVAASGTLYLARAHRGAAPALDRFTVTDRDLAVSTLALGAGDPALASEPSEILGMTASGGGYAVLWRRGATEDAASAVLLTTQLDEHEIAALHDALVVESMAWLAGSLSIVVSLEFARPSYVRLGADGELRTPPSTLAFGEEPPAPFAGRRVALVRGEPGALGVQVRDGAGDDVGPRIALPPSAQRADVARTPSGFAIVTSDGDADGRALTLRTLTCP